MIRLPSLLFWFGLLIAASLCLYRTSDHVAQLDRHLKDVNQSIEAERQSLHVLKAEWVYLSNPSRVEAEARKHLDLRPTSPVQVTTIDNLGAMLPTREQAAVVAANVAAKTVAAVQKPVTAIRTAVAALPAELPAMPHIKPATHSLAAIAANAHRDTMHVTDHMMIQRTASAQPLTDSISALLNRLDASTGHQ